MNKERRADEEESGCMGWRGRGEERERSSYQNCL